ncbi:MAG: permease-like cell division protein FtsX [Methylophilaceae bacterium]
MNTHLQALKLVLARMRQNKLSTFMISLVIAVALCIPALFYIGVNHLTTFTSQLQSETELSLFLKLDADQAAINTINNALASNKSIKNVKFVSKDEAWQQLKAKAETNDLDKNPLPDAFFIQSNTADPTALDALKSELSKLTNVEKVLLNTEWVKRLSAILALGKQIILLVAGLLAVALLVIISNTVRMQIITQKDEIIVSKLMGATNGFIRTPFLFAGMLYGFFGGLLAIIMLITLIWLFNQSIAQLSSLYHGDFGLPIIDKSLFTNIILFAIAIGWLGSYLAVTRAIAANKIN